VLILRGTTDLLRLVTGSAGDIRVHVSALDASDATPPVIQPIPDLGPVAAITTAATTTIAAAPGSTLQRNIKGVSVFNASATVTNTVTVELTDGTNVALLARTTLLPNEWLVRTENGLWLHFDSNGGLYQARANPVLFNQSVANQGPGFATDTYATGSFIVLPGVPKVGTRYRVKIALSKTAAGTATPILQVRVGTAGTTADTSRLSFTFSAGTAATDAGEFYIDVVFRSVGSGTSAVVQGFCSLTSQPTTGISLLIKNVQTTSAGFDSTVAGLGIGVSINGGTSAAWTVTLVAAELVNP
jgi:hypothetical protein